MRSLVTWKPGLVAALLAGSLIATTHAQAPQPAGGAPAAGAPARGGGPGARPIDPRIQQRTYTFAETGEEIPYAVFVSSKVSKDRKAPLIVALHGLGGNQNTMLSGAALDLAEEGGYIMVGPMGYNSSGWYGAPSSMASGAAGAGGMGMGGPPRGGGGPGAGGPRGGPPGAGRGGPGGLVVDTTTTRGAPPGAGPGGPGAGAPRGGPPGAGPGGPGFAAPTTLGVSNETSQRSEKDVMNVLEIIKKEFNVDEDRTYLMGHSMGGAGTIYLGVKYPHIWAAIGAEAPATQPAGIFPSNYSLAPAKHIPMIIIQGTNDPLVPHLTSTRPWIEQMKELGITHKYVEEEGGDHGTVIALGAREIFPFFAQHTRKPAR